MKKHEGWMNIYHDGWGGYYGTSIWNSEETAKRIAEKDAFELRDKCVTTVKIEWEEEE